MKIQLNKKSIVGMLFFFVILMLGFQPGAAQKKTTANISEIVSQTTDISALAQKTCKKVKTIDDRTGSDFDLMCGGANGYNFYFWLDSETKKPTGWGYVRNAKIPNFYPVMAIGEVYDAEADEDNAESPNERATSAATEYGNSPEYRRKVGDQIEWFTRGGKTVAYAIHAFFFKDPDNTLKVLNSKKASAEFVFVRGLGDYESLEHDLKVRSGGNADEQARILVTQYFAKKN